MKMKRKSEELNPDLEMLKQIVDSLGIIVTAPGDNVNFVSRFFGPLLGIPENPVTGSMHTTLTPYWAKTRGKETPRSSTVQTRW